MKEQKKDRPEKKYGTFVFETSDDTPSKEETDSFNKGVKREATIVTLKT